MLQFITHYNNRYDTVTGTRAVLEGGCRWVQLRMKDASDADVIAAGREVGAMCRDFGATFLLDDRVHLVEPLGADGVHLGKNDIAVDKARLILGPDRIIGSTANEYADIERAAGLGADYIGLGPFRFTTTKQRLSPVLGIEGYRDIMGRCRRDGIGIPVVAIGGITSCDVPGIMATGVTGIAVSGALLNAPSPQDETRLMIEIINKYINTEKI